MAGSLLTRHPGLLGAGTAAILPIILGYFAFAHWVFRGKTGAEVGYEEQAG